MKSRILEKGSSAHIVIIIVLVVALLGALGFVFWQNFVNKPATTSITESSAETKQVTSSDNMLVVKEWGVKGDIGELADVSYTIDDETNQADEGYQSMTISADGLPAECNNLSVGKTVRLTANQQIPVAAGPSESTAKEAFDSNDSGLAAHVGEYYYFYYGPVGNVCWSGDDDPIYDQVTQTIKSGRSFVETLIASS
jgi:hypothetical protein